MALQKTKLVLVFLVLILAVSSVVAAVKTFKVQETDLVKLNAEAVDPDNDAVSYYYSSPLDKNGVWQTTFNDAGEYPITVIASDGVNQNTEEILLVVENKNQPPAVSENKIVVKETQTVNLKEVIFDPDGDALSYIFERPFDENGVWETGYEDAGSFVVDVAVSDGMAEVKARIQIEVLNTNCPPSIVNSFSEAKVVDMEEDSNLEFFAEANDADVGSDLGQDSGLGRLTYSWKLDGNSVGDESRGSYYFDYGSAGEHLLQVAVSDGMKEAGKEWAIKVANVNRKPVLNLLPLTVKEGENAVLDLPVKDLDGDTLKFSFEEKFDGNGAWQTTYGDAGEYLIDVYASDGELTAKEKAKVTVENVDRAPVLNLPGAVYVEEGGKLSFIIDAFDLDGDNVNVKFKNSPEYAGFDSETKEFSFEPDYDFIKRNGGLISNVLNALRLENLLLRSRTTTVEVESCSNELCVHGSFDLVVYNTNKGPVFEEMLNNISVTETEELKLTAKASDPDGDIVRVSFSEPLGRVNGGWQTGFGDRGNYVVYAAATDGRETATVPVNVKVLPKNREPTLKLEKDEYAASEGEELSFAVKALDPDGDVLSVSLEKMPEGASLADGLFTWMPRFNITKNTAGTFTDRILSKNKRLNDLFNKKGEVVWLNFIASDGEFDVVHPVKVIVRNVNQKPELVDYLPPKEETAKVGEPVVFHLAVKDSDSDELNYRWDFGFGQDEVSAADTIERTFVSPGEKKIKVTVSDGQEEIEQEWVVNVLGEDSDGKAVRKDLRFIKDHIREKAMVKEDVKNVAGKQPVQLAPAYEEARFKVYVIKG